MFRFLSIAILSLVALGWTHGSGPLFFANDGSSLPWSQTAIGPSAFYSSSTNTTWFCWEGWETVSGTPQRVAEATTKNHTTNKWVTNAQIGTRTLVGDVHGIPACSPDSSGYGLAFYGAHNSSIKVSVTTSANDSSSWNDAYTISGTYTFPNPYLVGSTIYLFSSGPGAGNDNQEAITVTPVTTSVGVPSFGTRKTLFDSATAGNLGWLPLGTFAVVSTKIHFVFTYGTQTGAAPNTGIYYAIYDTTNGTVCNYSGSTCVVSASQPIGLTSLNANFKIQSFTRGGFPSIAVDGSGNSHVVYADGSASPAILSYTTANGGAWSSPHTVYVWPSLVDAFNGEGGPVPNASGGVDIYFGDGKGDCSFPLAGNTVGGNMLSVTRSSGGNWSFPTTILPMSGKCIDNPQPISNPSTKARVIFTETSTDDTIIDGHLKGWAYGDNGFLTR